MNKIAKKKKESNGKLVNIDINDLPIEGGIDELKLLNVLLIRDRERNLPAVATQERLVTAGEFYEMGQVAKILNYPNMGRTNLFRFLRDEEILRPSYSRIENEPYQKYITDGWFVINLVPYKKGNTEKTYSKVMATMKGIDKIRERLDAYFSGE